MHQKVKELSKKKKRRPTTVINDRVKLMAILADTGIDWRDRNLTNELYIIQKEKAFVMVGETISEACTYSIGREGRQGCSLSIVVYHLW